MIALAPSKTNNGASATIFRRESAIMWLHFPDPFFFQMVRNYARKTQRGRGYSKETLAEAIQSVKSKILGLRAASKKYSIPYSTLQCYLTGRRGKKSQTGGRCTALRKEDEELLVAYLKTLEKSGFGLSRKELLDVIQQYVNRNKIQTPFKNGRPGKDWFILFRMRNRLAIKKPQSVEYVRKKQTDPFVINEYFNLLETTLQRLSLVDKPHLVWNLDETSMCTDPSKTKVVGEKGRPSSRTTGGTGKENFTCLVAANANGGKAPPLVIFKGLNLWSNWVPESVNNKCPNMTFAASKNGWINCEIFVNFLKNNLLPSLTEKRPVLIIYDGHATHVTEEVIAFAKTENIEILKLPAHTSHLLQPLDLSVFKSVKVTWDENLCVWQRKNPGRRISKAEFALLFGKIWANLDVNVIKSGFKKGGIFPLNREVISPEIYDPDIWSKFQKFEQQKNNRLIEDTTANVDPLTDQTKDTSANSDAFKEILLETIRSNKPVNQVNKPRKKIASGAEVLTSTVAHAILDSKSMKEKKETKINGTEQNNIMPSTSGTASKRKFKRQARTDLHSSSESSEYEEPTYIDTDDDMDTESNDSRDSLSRPSQTNDKNHSGETLQENKYPESDDSEEMPLSEVKKRNEEKKQEEIVVGTYIKVELKSEKSKKVFIGLVTEIIEPFRIYNCSFLKAAIGQKYPKNTYVFPEIEDKSMVYKNEILECLKGPLVRRGHYTFSPSYVFT